MIIVDTYVNGTLVYASHVVEVPKIVYPTNVFLPKLELREFESLIHDEDSGVPIIIKESNLLWDDGNEILFDDNTNIKL